MAAWIVSLTITLPWIGALTVWLIGDRRPKHQHRIASAFAIVGGAFSLGLLSFIGEIPIIQISLGSVFGEFTIIADGLGVSLAIIAAVVGGLAVVFSNEYMKNEAQLGRYYALTLLFIGAMIALVLSGSLLFMFLFWEITAFCSYALISFHNDDPKAVAGGIKALIITSLGGVGLLIGTLLSYSYLGSYQIDVFLSTARMLPGQILGFLAFGFLAAAAAKSAQFPFQSWLPDAMEAPTPISALIHAATMVNAGVYLLARFYPAFESVPGWKSAVMVIGLLSAILAALMAIFCNDLKRTLAYSTISQLGYMVYAIGVGGIFASQNHLLSHSVFKALLFLGAGSVIHAIHTRDMVKIAGAGRHMPVVRVLFIIGSLALIGLPITNGFFSKELILENGLILGPTWAYAVMLLVAGLTGLYTVRMVSLVFYGKETARDDVHDAPPAMQFSLILLAVGTLTTWLLTGGFNRILAETLPYHQIPELTTGELLTEIISSTSTWLIVAFVLLVASTWFIRNKLFGLLKKFTFVVNLINSGFGFDWFNQQIVRFFVGTASTLQITQTGFLSWNMVLLVSGMILIFIIILWTS